MTKRMIEIIFLILLWMKMNSNVMASNETSNCRVKDVYVEKGQNFNTVCECLGDSITQMSWSFQNCSNLLFSPDFCQGINTTGDFQSENLIKLENSLLMPIKFNTMQPGVITCKASGNSKDEIVQGFVKVIDLPKPFVLTGFSESHKIAIGDFVELECGAVKYDFSNSIQWMKDGKPIGYGEGILIKNSNTEYSWRKKLIFNSISHENVGKYECKSQNINTKEFKTLSVNIKVYDPIDISITTNFNETTITKIVDEVLTLECNVDGIPMPTLIWKKDDQIFNVSEKDTRVTMKNQNMNLTFASLRFKDSGKYECIAQNRFENVSRIFEVVIEKGPIDKRIIIGVICVFIALISICAYLYYSRNKIPAKRENN
ncbi:hypothetical protein PVAND_017193 [Polypedilum vanderplanki]|uniref:Ig-like domain-containing protein n=1 Tax=Polypedilum vanderplanki TaxID=319348 RepID=A0A9J6BHE0_POLVA|nr:hypothetical protein PVAND_017193 [Polypedilum vanderplanki]